VVVLAASRTSNASSSVNSWLPSSHNGDSTSHHDPWGEAPSFGAVDHDNNPWARATQRLSPPPQPLPAKSSTTARSHSQGTPSHASGPTPQPVVTVTLSKEEKAAEMARRKEERKQVGYIIEQGIVWIDLLVQRIAQLKEQKKNASLKS
jgi:hypothetical protein